MAAPYPGFDFSEQQQLICDSIHELVSRTIPPERLRELDESYGDPLELYEALAEGGWLGLPYDEAYGGSAGSYKDLAVLIEALGYHSLSYSTIYMATVIFGGMYIHYSGSPEMKQRFLPKIIDGSLKMAIAYTEPGAGSDVAGITTRARREGNHYVVQGQKCYISCAHLADYVVTAVKTDPEAGRKGISLLAVPMDAPGVEVRRMKSMGRHASGINEIFYDDVQVPPENMIGEENSGWRKMMQALNLERVLLAAGASGLCMKAIDLAKGFAAERRTFGQPIASYQAISHKLAEMQILAQSSRLHTYRVADLLDRGEDPVMETAIAKTFACEAMFKCADLGLQIMGGQGYVQGDMERLFRDARLGSIGGGTSEIMRNVIAGRMGV